MTKISTFITQFENGIISRRDFVKALMAVGLSISSIDGILALSEAKAAAVNPKKGGVLKAAFALGSPNETLDPARAYSDIDSSRAFQVYNTLVWLTPDLKPVPELAESWEGNKTADEWIFRLRKGVEFHDGRKLRAEDVNYSLRRVMDPKTGSASRPLLGDVDPDGIKVEDEHTIRIKLIRPNSDFPVVMFDFRLQIIPEGFTDFDHAIGTGPFKVKEWKPGVRFVAERNPNYWKSGLPLVDEVETFAIPDKVARVNALLAGEIHLMAMLDPGLIDKIKATSGVKVMASKSGNQIGFVMNCTTPPYDNVDVRLALKHLVDREKYLQTVYKGLGQIANDHPIPPLSKDYCTSIPIRKYDPEKAKSLLKKAGVLDYTFELYSTDAFAGAMEGALVYSQMALRAGVKIKVIRSPADGYWDAIWLKKPFCATQWNTRPAIMALRFAFLSDASMNETSWKRPKFDQLFLETMATMEESKRKNLFCEMQRMIHDDGGLILPVFPHILDACSAKVKGLIENPFSSMGGWKFAETAWLEG